MSIGTLLLYNIPFFNYVTLNTNEDTGGQIVLLVSLAVIMLVLNFMMTYLTVWLTRIVGRILLAILSLINATAVYFIVTYSVLVDATTVENVFNTRYAEASGFFSWGLWLFIFALGVLSALYCLLQPVVFGSVSLINTLRTMTDWHSAVVFISDHGESLGENKLYMHGLPMKLAPKVQYEIPFLVWTSENFRCYKSTSELPAVLEQHYVFHSVLNLLSIQSPAYNKDYDIFEIILSKAVIPSAGDKGNSPFSSIV